MTDNKTKEFAVLAVEALEDKKAEDIAIIDISEVSVIADYFIIAGGNNKSQIQALSDVVDEKLGRAGLPLKQIEGYNNANWILLDFGDIIVHIFDKENRLFYDLERIWCDGKKIELNDIHAFLSYLTVNNNSKAATRARKASSIRVFFNYLCAKANLIELRFIPLNPFSLLSSSPISLFLDRLSLTLSTLFNLEDKSTNF